MMLAIFDFAIISPLNSLKFEPSIPRVYTFTPSLSVFKSHFWPEEALNIITNKNKRKKVFDCS